MKDTLEAKRRQYEHLIEDLDLTKQMAEEEAAYDEIAPNIKHEKKEAEEEGGREAEKIIYFNPDRVVEHRRYDIGIEIQSACSVPSVEINGVMLLDEQYLHLLRSLNLRQREFFRVGRKSCSVLNKMQRRTYLCIFIRWSWCWQIYANQSTVSKSV